MGPGRMIVETYHGKSLEETTKSVAKEYSAKIRRVKNGAIRVYFISGWTAVRFLKQIQGLGVRINGNKSSNNSKVFVEVKSRT